ncbi:F0F1 ATP synthase subunit gamma [Salegentibacter flavus]|uniref:F-type H+-transporting ATPase subunit gamma n=1 Tax=Salegentibacter flavus TaxID=287099 RepID=A0A1I4YA34_9FLAO|nr:F0F1 ATP synthase subunit gamma [Salegentibacter flavus]SFN34872.1 F-type H+-transporting ATPase subunit gamma [Salegentibacter flavus]
MDTLESLRRKLGGAGDLKSVVRTMKTMAASNIGQYESAVNSLGDYYRTVTLGILAFFSEQDINLKEEDLTSKKNDSKSICAIVFGSDQGLVGPFNDSLSDFVSNSLQEFPGEKEIWVVGERIQFRLMDLGLNVTKLFSVPNSVNAITVLVREILIKSLENFETEEMKEYYLFHNQPKPPTGYKSVMQKLLPLEKKWLHVLDVQKWPTKNLPQVAGGKESTLKALIREFLFVSLFKASAESSVSENSSRLAAMQRAEKNIDEMLDDLGGKFHHRRQSAIDEELFDLISGFEALKEDPKT